MTAETRFLGENGFLSLVEPLTINHSPSTIGSPMVDFFSERIEVTCKGHPARPASFVWRGKEYHVREIRASWQEWKSPPGSPRGGSWRLRRHRNHYHALTDTGELFEIYLDRGRSGKKEWVLLKRL